MARTNSGKSTLYIPILISIAMALLLVARIYIKGPFQTLLNPDSQIGWKSISDLERDKENYHSSLVLFDFSADWCQPCKRMDKVTFQAQDVVKKVRESFYPVKVIVGSEHEKKSVTDLQTKYSLFSIPTFVVTLPSGEWVYQKRGFFPPKDFIKMLDNAKLKSYFVRAELKMAKQDYKGALAELNPDVVSGKKQIEDEIPMMVYFHILKNLGRLDEAKVAVKKRFDFVYSKKKNAIQPGSDKPLPWPLPFYQYLLGELDEDKLMRATSAWYQKSEINCAIALNALENNQKDLALKTFHKAAESSYYSNSDSFRLAELYIKELEP
ncbi:MAG: thioredoxin fold domain-containing protein [Cyanobacteria bacterium TGS_CYA1]|nr:thioredoxin fold domain-containing protein [Cyanobacteria bacterium TGS_CYA1]